jgi:hypothetical protein
MKWLDISKEPCALECVYCGQSGKFPHVKSYDHEDETLSLYACTRCKSLIYDLSEISAPVVSQTDAPDGVISNEARWTVETGFSSYHVAACAMSSLPEIPDHELRNHVFVDVGAGMGMASHFVKTLFGMPVVTIEPSYTGKLAQEILGLHVHRAYFEDLPEDVLAELANKPCFLHLNSVVEHLVDPAAVLADMIGRARVDVLAAIVPDGAAMDFNGPFLNALPFLAPRDHRHLPTELGVELLLKRLGFQHVAVEVSAGLLTGIGSRYPMPVSSERMNRLSEQVFLENLKRHPNPIVATGGASRLLPGAVLNGNTPLVAELVSFFSYEDRAGDLLEKVVNRDWDHLEFHLGQTCYWLAYTALQGGRLPNALALLEITKAFADAMADDYPPQCMTALEYKWAAMILESHILNAMGDPAAAEGPLLAVIAAKSDPKQGPRDTYVHQAEIALQALRATAKTRQDEEVAEATA